MTKIRLQTRFLAPLLAGVLAVTLATLLEVRHVVGNQIRAEISSDLQTSVLTFRAFQTEREATLSHTAELMADLPTVKALMTTDHTATIQDASNRTWHLSGSDLLVLGSPDAEIMAVHANANAVQAASVKEAVAQSIHEGANTAWWSLNGHLYEVFLQPIYFGRSGENRLLGILALGYEIDQNLATQVSRITGSAVTFQYGPSVVASTLDSTTRDEFARHESDFNDQITYDPQGVQLGEERYMGASVKLTSGDAPNVRLTVLKSYDQAAARFRSLYRILAGMGVLSLLGTTLLAFAIFRRYTRPLEKLVAGVRALGNGDFAYPLEAHGNDELAEATASFIRMRDDLQQAQRKLLESERLATIGRMASSISHDLRHQLTSVVANSEFLSEPDLDREQSEELYQEIRDAVGRMTDLIDSLLEFSKGRDTLSLSYVSVEDTVQHAIRTVLKHPSVEEVAINLSCRGCREGWFDSKKLERVFYNLILNACQAVTPVHGRINVGIQELPEAVEVRISDNGTGIPEHLHEKIFEPFVSHAKEHGTGLGLTIVQMLLEQHGGTIKLESSSPEGTTFQVILPLDSTVEAETPDDVSIGSSTARLL
ncbi:MAG TPA: HAMP domain-containing sensor histidine kinase [Candidatus Angelobacter sp.]